MTGDITSIAYPAIMSNRFFYLFLIFFSSVACLNTTLSIVHIVVIRGIRKIKLSFILLHASPIRIQNGQHVKKDMEVKIKLSVRFTWLCFIIFGCSKVTLLITPI